MSVKYPNWVTLYTDANPHAWGAYARAELNLPNKPGKSGFRIESRGRFQRELDVNIAECRAIMNGIRMVLSHWENVEGIGVRTDSKNAIRWLRFGAPKHNSEKIQKVQREFKNLVRSIKVRFRWVKGHQGTSTVPGWLNDRVDQHAAQARKRTKKPLKIYGERY